MICGFIIHECKSPLHAAAGVITDRALRQLARKAGGKRVDIGLELHIEWAEIETLQARHPDPVDLAFHILMVNNKNSSHQTGCHFTY